MPFWLWRERRHFFGDGYLLIRDHGDSETMQRGPLTVRLTVLAVRAAERHLRLHAEADLHAFAARCSARIDFTHPDAAGDGVR